MDGLASLPRLVKLVLTLSPMPAAALVCLYPGFKLPSAGYVMQQAWEETPGGSGVARANCG